MERQLTDGRKCLPIIYLMGSIFKLNKEEFNNKIQVNHAGVNIQQLTHVRGEGLMSKVFPEKNQSCTSAMVWVGRGRGSSLQKVVLEMKHKKVKGKNSTTHLENETASVRTVIWSQIRLISKSVKIEDALNSLTLSNQNYELVFSCNE